MEATAETDNHTSGKIRTAMGYTTSLGEPRQPKATQENKTGTLRYEQETETWHCAKCDKSYTSQNARSARTHAEEHTKTEKSTRGTGKGHHTALHSA